MVISSDMFKVSLGRLSGCYQKHYSLKCNEDDLMFNLFQTIMSLMTPHQVSGLQTHLYILIKFPRRHKSS